MYYKDDRDFTDKVHKEIAVPLIYRKLQWFDIRNSTKVENNILFVGLGFNKDKSSSFVSFDIKLLKQTVPNIILLSAGF